MALWSMQAHPLNPDLARWAVKAVNLGLKADPVLARLMVLSADLKRPEEGEATDAWYELARQDDRGLILRFLTVVLGNPETGLGWLHHVWPDLIHMGRPEIAMAALDMVKWTGTSIPLRARFDAERALHYLPPEEAMPAIESLDPTIWGLWRAYAGSELLLRMGRAGEAKGSPGRAVAGHPVARQPDAQTA